MPNIEIISIRLNLDKDDDRKLFEQLRKQLRKVDGSRNEFLKHLLLAALSGYQAAGAAEQPSRRQAANKRAGAKPTTPKANYEKNAQSVASDADSADLVASFVS